jgi:hypothetical protein
VATESFPPEMLITSMKMAIMIVPIRREQSQQQSPTFIAILQKDITL